MLKHTTILKSLKFFNNIKSYGNNNNNMLAINIMSYSNYKYIQSGIVQIYEYSDRRRDLIIDLNTFIGKFCLLSFMFVNQIVGYCYDNRTVALTCFIYLRGVVVLSDIWLLTQRSVDRIPLRAVDIASARN